MSPNQPGFSDRNPPPSNRQLLILFGIFLAFAAVVIWLLSWLISGLIDLIPISFEHKVGNLIVPVYEQQAEPSPTQETLNTLLNRLEENLDSDFKQNRGFQVLYIPQDTVNAIAIPGDTIVLYQGLLEQVQSENELMMVLGHELGHFAHRDHLRKLGRVLLVRMAIAYFLGDTSALQSVASTAGTAIANAQYSQSQEQQADAFGLALLYDTYGHVAGATDFFQRLSEQEKRNLAFLSTHPAPKKRVRELQQLIQEKNYPIETRSPLPETLTKEINFLPSSLRKRN
ncbi:MAG: M48 family metallopeptidase [Chroococcales cyanobacterium]